MTDQAKLLWFVWAPGEDAPQMHRSLESASPQADLIARMQVGIKTHVYQLQSVGSITHPNTPLIPESDDTEDVIGEGLTEAELSALIDGFKDTNIHTLVAFAAASGMRRNELLSFALERC